MTGGLEMVTPGSKLLLGESYGRGEGRQEQQGIRELGVREAENTSLPEK